MSGLALSQEYDLISEISTELVYDCDYSKISFTASDLNETGRLGMYALRNYDPVILKRGIAHNLSTDHGHYHILARVSPGPYAMN